MGVVKPWAPPRSYGLVIRLNARRPCRSTRCTAGSTASQPRRRRGGRSGRRAVRARQGAGPRCCALPLADDRDGDCAHERHRSSSCARRQRLYAGVPAIEGVDFALRRGEIHALVGENGAGKSTLTKVMAGVVTLTSGHDAGRRRRGRAEDAAARRCHLGIAMVFQENSLVPTMTVAQNLFLGQERSYNRLRGIYIAAQQFLQSLQFRRRPDRDRRPARRRQEADGRDRARRAAQGQGHHLRRADRDADAGGEEVFLRPGASTSKRAASRSSSSRTRSRRRCSSPTGSRSCATASMS